LETDELNEWLRVQAEKEEDNLALVKYTKEDDSKEKDLSLAIQKLVLQVNKRKASITAEVTETLVAQIELENTTTIFKSLHQERQDLISKWEDAVKSMREKDNEINQAHSDYREQKQAIRKIRDKLSERNTIYEGQLKLNSDAEKGITLSERKMFKLKYF
jgi:UDP-glucose:O-linked fucose beta-1,3-glucosyltransferase